MVIKSRFKDYYDFVATPVDVSNREKILKAGFDLKQSFRHRVGR